MWKVTMASGTVYNVSDSEAKAVAEAFIQRDSSPEINTLIGFEATLRTDETYQVRVNAEFIESVSENLIPL